MLTSLHYYLNLENTLIPRSFFPTMMSKGRQSYFRAVEQLPSSVTLTAPAKDWLVLQQACPDLISLINQRGIPVVPSLFSHTLPTLFTESLPSQVEHGLRATTGLLQHACGTGIIPENDVSSSIVAPCQKHWRGVLYSVSHFRLAGQSRVKFAPGYWRLQSTEERRVSPASLLIISNDPAREAYLHMYREAKSVSDALRTLRVREDDPLPEASALLTDFERAWSNCTILSQGETSPPRMDIWTRFHRRRRQERSLSLNFLDEFNRRSANAPLLALPSQSMRMWRCPRSRWLVALQQEAMCKNLLAGDYFELASLVACSCMPPRVLCRILDRDEFPASYKGKPGHVEYIGDVSKVHELLLICKNIRYRRRVSHNTHSLPLGSKMYLRLLDQALQTYARQQGM